MNAIIAIAFKDLKLLLRDRGGFFFTFFYPILFALFFGMVFNGGSKQVSALKIDAVDADQTAASRHFLKLLSNAEELNVSLTDSVRARQDVLGGKRVAYLIVQKGYGRARHNPFTGQTPRITLGIDPSKKAEAGMLEGILMKYAVQDMEQTFADTKLMKENTQRYLQILKSDPSLPAGSKSVLTDLFRSLNRLWDDSQLSAPSTLSTRFSPLTIKEEEVTREPQKQLNSFSFTFPQGIVWGLLACAISFAVSLVGERTKGTLFRIQAASVKKYQVLAGKALASFATSMIMAVGLIFIGVVGFGIRVHSVFMLLFALSLVSLAFVGIMVLFSVLGQTERAVSGMSWALVLPMAMVGGGMIPLTFMPSWLQAISVVSPFKWAILSIEGSLWRAFTWGQIVQPLLILLLIGLGAFLIGLKYFKWE